MPFGYGATSRNNPLRSESVALTGDNKGKKVKQVYSTDEIAHLWAHKTQSSARNAQGNFYFEGDTIYSYGSHFPIARHVTNKRGQAAILFTTGSYSNTTSQHVYGVRQAIPPGIRVFSIGRDVRLTPDKTMFELEYRKAFEKATIAIEAKGTQRRTKAKLFAELTGTISDANNFAMFFGLRDRLKIPKRFESDAFKAEIIEGLAQSERATEAAQRAADTRRANRNKEWANRSKSFDERLPLWLAGDKTVSVRDSPASYLRLRGDEVETSLGARIPADHAVKAMRLIQALRKRGKVTHHPEIGGGLDTLYERNGHTIHLGHYALDKVLADGTIKAGCHTITASEFDRFSEVLRGWETTHPSLVLDNSTTL